MFNFSSLKDHFLAWLHPEPAHTFHAYLTGLENELFQLKSKVQVLTGSLQPGQPTVVNPSTQLTLPETSIESTQSEVPQDPAA